MSELLLEITPEFERRLEEQARRRGLSASDYARELVETGLAESTEAVPPNVAAWRALTQEERRRRLEVDPAAEWAFRQDAPRAWAWVQVQRHR